MAERSARTKITQDRVLLELACMGFINIRCLFMAGALTVPRWRAVVQAVAAYVREGSALSDDQLRAVRAVLRAQSKG
jgi:hypothetical protein